MINVILYPTIFIGIFLISWAIALYTLQFIQPQIAKESDIILSTIASLCGGILFFQGWRLDPLLFTCYILLVVTILLLSLELFQLRTFQKEQVDFPPNLISKVKTSSQPFFKESNTQKTQKKSFTKTKKYSAFLQKEFIKPQIKFYSTDEDTD